MKRLQRLPLSPTTQAFLGKRTSAVARAADPRAEASRLWDLQQNRAFQEIRATLRQMASGIERCMYCEDGAGTAIEHFWPKASYPDRAFAWANYLLACSLCNSNFKRDQFPCDASGRPLLIDPTEEEPLDHLTLSPSTGSFLARSPKGEWSIRVFGLGRDALEKGRRAAWTALEILLIGYAQAHRNGDGERSARIEFTVRHHPFAGVLAALLRMARGPDAALLVAADCLAALRRHPEIHSWNAPPSPAQPPTAPPPV